MDHAEGQAKSVTHWSTNWLLVQQNQPIICNLY
jgi:hypothetical protein